VVPSCRNDQAERFHNSTNLVRKLGGDPDQPGASRHERPGQHAVETFHAHLAKEPDFCKLRQTIGIIRIRLIRRHIERSFGVAGIDSDCR
jgi:hypothetical protein